MKQRELLGSLVPDYIPHAQCVPNDKLGQENSELDYHIPPELIINGGSLEIQEPLRGTKVLFCVHL